jgi:hypothetical protein
MVIIFRRVTGKAQKAPRIVVFARTPITKLFLSIHLQTKRLSSLYLLVRLTLAYLIQNCNFYFYFGRQFVLEIRNKALIIIY